MLFFERSVEQIIEICGVTRSTAYSYKNGNRKPSTQVVKLMQLHINQRVLDQKSWPRGWRIQGATLMDPEGNITTEGQLRGYGMLMQLIAEWSRHDEAKRTEAEPILELMHAARRTA